MARCKKCDCFEDCPCHLSKEELKQRKLDGSILVECEEDCKDPCDGQTKALVAMESTKVEAAPITETHADIIIPAWTESLPPGVSHIWNFVYGLWGLVQGLWIGLKTILIVIVWVVGVSLAGSLGSVAMPSSVRMLWEKYCPSGQKGDYLGVIALGLIVYPIVLVLIFLISGLIVHGIIGGPSDGFKDLWLSPAAILWPYLLASNFISVTYEIGRMNRMFPPKKGIKNAA